MTEIVDVTFTIRGTEIPADHGYALFEAVAAVVPQISHEPGWAIAPIHGRVVGDTVRLGFASRLRLRLPATDVGRAMELTGRELEVGSSAVHLGTAEIRPLKPSRVLSADVNFPSMATHRGIENAARQELLAVVGERHATTLPILVGHERVVRARASTVMLHRVAIGDLPPSASLALQAKGMGLRRYMGAGVFEAA